MADRDFIIISLVLLMMAEQHSGARARIMSLFVSSARLDANTAKMAVFHVRLRSLNKVTVPVRRRVHVSGEASCLYWRPHTTHV